MSDEQALRARVAELEHRLERLNQAEEQALTARAQAQAVIDNIPHMAWMKNTEGVFLSVNKPFARACGRPVHDILGMTDYDVWPAELAELYVTDDRKVVAAGQTVFVEEPIAEISGKKWFETFKTPVFDAKGNCLGTVGLARDITERKQAEEQQRQSDAHTQRTQYLESLGVLAGGIAHDFNNLLVGVLGNAELAAHDLLSLPAAELSRRCVEDIRKAALRAAELTSQMLAYSGRGHFTVRPLCLDEAVRETIPLVQGAFATRRARVACHLQEELSWVEADVAQIHQMVLNLLMNAAEALDAQGGTITVRTGHESVHESQPADLYGLEPLACGNYAFLEVSDDGCGMGEETRKRLFEPFFTTKFTGRGLGLSAVHGMVRSHGGGIVVSSAVGVGTSIRVLLPRTDKTPVAAPPRSDERWQGTGCVLLIDDDDEVRRVAQLLLQHLGFEVIAVASGAEALEAYRTSHQSLTAVMLDMTMPDMAGEEVFAKLAALGNDVPVVVCSGYDREETLVHFGGAAIAGFVHKPFTLEVLQRILRDLQRTRA